MKIRTNEVPARNLDYLTVNREYMVHDFKPDRWYRGKGWVILDNGIEGFLLLEHCAFLDGRNWEVIPE